MSIPQTNFENNNRMSELTKNINDIFGYILLYSVIIFTALSALLGGIVVYPIYGAIYIFNKIRETCCKSEAAEAEAEAEAEIVPEKKPIIDENWCNISVKNIINYTNEIQNEIQNEVEDISNAEDEEEEVANEVEEKEIADISNAEDVNLENEIQSEAEQNEIAVEEVLSIRRPSEEELRKKEEEEASEAEDISEAEEEDDSPKDKYSIGHYKSKPHINDPLDFDN